MKYGMLVVYLYLLVSLLCSASNALHPFNRVSTFSRTGRRVLSDLHMSDSNENIDDSIFGAEFKSRSQQEVTVLRKDKVGYKEVRVKVLDSEKRQEVMAGYDSMRFSFVADSLFVAAIGLCATWYIGSYKDVLSYGIGAVLGAAYAVLLSSYVEKVGSQEKNTSGSLRFAPVILLVAVYSKNKEYLSIIPELLGFFSYQVGSLLQIFNEGAYESKKTKD